MDNKPKLYLKSPHMLWLLVGGTASCIIPVLMGLNMYLGRGRNPDVLEMAVWMTFVFGAIIAAWLGCFKVYLNQENGFSGVGDFIVIGIKSATIVHCVASILIISSVGLGAGFVDIMLVYLFSLMFQIPLWFCVTLPLSALCGWIFSLVATERRERAAP